MFIHIYSVKENKKLIKESITTCQSQIYAQLPGHLPKAPQKMGCLVYHTGATQNEDINTGFCSYRYFLLNSFYLRRTE